MLCLSYEPGTRGQAPDPARPPGSLHSLELPAQPRCPGRSLTTFRLRGTLPNLSSIMQMGNHQSQNPKIPSLWSHFSLMTTVILTPSPKEETASWCRPSGPLGAQTPAWDGSGPGQDPVSQWGAFVAVLLLSQRALEISWQCRLPEEWAERSG